MNVKSKVFGIGFHKTGTKSLAKALTSLGYRVTGPNWIHDQDVEKSALTNCKKILSEYDAFQDNPWPMFYKELDVFAPNSKFILTIRDPEDWIRSVVNYFGSNETPMRRWIYGHGSPIGHEQVYLDRYIKHNAEVLEYFQDRGSDLLVVDLQEPDAGRLCGFLECDLDILKAYPHENIGLKTNA